MRRTVLGVVLAASLVTIAGTVGGTTAALPAGDESRADGDAGVETRVQAANGTGCNYTDLYEETIRGVVQVQVATPNASTGGGGGLGSGFVYERSNETNASYVVTNQHVVRDQETVSVEFSRGESVVGDVVGTDVYSDLAVVEVAETPGYVEALPVTRETPRPGERVAAFGSPFGLEGTITEGIVSAVDRSMPTRQGFQIPNTVQTDAPINPGNSGGPLVTCAGDVVGVNRAGGGQNIGFAIGASLLERVVPALIERGEFDHAYLGVRTVPLSPPLAEANDLETTTGVYVHETVPDGPAADALRGSTGTETVDDATVPVGGDVVVSVDGRTVRTGEELAGYLATETSPGDEVEVTVIRDGERETVAVTLGERPEPELGTGPPE